MPYSIGSIYSGKDERGVEYICLCSTIESLGNDDGDLPLGIVLDGKNAQSPDIESIVDSMSTYNDSHMLYNMNRLENAVELVSVDVSLIQKIINGVNAKGKAFMESRKYYRPNKINLGLVYEFETNGNKFIAIRNVRDYEGYSTGGYLYGGSDDCIAWYSRSDFDTLKPRYIGYMKLYGYHVHRNLFAELNKIDPHRGTFHPPFDVNKAITFI